MRTATCAGSFRLLVLGFAFVFCTATVQAAEWQWSSQPGRERLEVRLDQPQTGPPTVARSGTNSVDIVLQNPPASLNASGQAPASGSLVQALQPENGLVRVNTSTPAFGFIWQQTGPQSFVMDFFPDPMGARWQPSDIRGGISPAPAPAASPAPGAPGAQGNQQSAVQPPAGVTVPAATPSTPAQPNPPTAQAGQTSPAVVPPAAAPAAQTAPQAVTQPSPLPPAAVQTAPPAGGGQTQAPAMAQSAPPPSAQGQASPPQAISSNPVQAGQTPPQLRGTASPVPEAANRARGQLSAAAPGGQAPAPVQNPVQPQNAAAPSAQAPATVSPPSFESGRMAEQVARGLGSAASPAQTDVQIMNSGATQPSAPSAAQAPAAESRAPLLQQGLPATPPQPRPDATAPGEVTNDQLSALTQRIETTVPPADAAQQAPAPLPQNTAMAAGNQPEPQPTAQSAPGQAAPAVQAAPGAAAPQAAPPASAASPTPETASLPPRQLPSQGTGIRAQFSTAGPEAWTKDEGLSSIVVAPPAAQQAQEQKAGTGDVKGTSEGSPKAGAEKEAAKEAKPKAEDKKEAHGKEEAKAEPQVVYVDEAGNPVEKPKDSEAMLVEAKKLISAMQYGPALAMLNDLKGLILPPEKREEVLYLISETLFSQYTGRFPEGLEAIVSATNEAMNFNLRSGRVAEALDRLAQVNLNVGNQLDAKAYFEALRSKFPKDPAVAAGFLMLGADQLQRSQYAEAVQNLQVVLEDYPESGSMRDAARYMAEALYRQGHYERAMTLIDFVDRRWPRLYLDAPGYLEMVADVAYHRGRLDDALRNYWIAYNLTPKNPANDKLLLTMGSIYMQQGDRQAMREVFAELINTYPNSPAVPTAILRQGEEGIFEGNMGVDDLFAMFAQSGKNTLPDIAYAKLLADFPNSEEAKLASIRLAVWRLWTKDYSGAMDQAERFLQTYQDTPFAPRADEVILRAFQAELPLDLQEQNYERILSRWERFPQIRGAYATPDDDLRVALARALLNRGEEAKAHEWLDVFLDRPKDPHYGEYVFKLNLGRWLRTSNWEQLLKLGEKVADWDLGQEDRNQLIYTLAIAHENMGQGQQAIPLWEKLYRRDDIPLYQKAYATYFMAREAERQRNIKDTYQLNLDTLRLFTQLEAERSDKADPERIRESLAALMDVTEVASRYAEALEWLAQYSAFVPETSPDYAGLRMREARLHRKLGDLARWRTILEGVVAREPDSVFGRMAASELRTQQVARDLTRFAPEPK